MGTPETKTRREREQIESSACDVTRDGICWWTAENYDCARTWWDLEMSGEGVEYQPFRAWALDMMGIEEGDFDPILAPENVCDRYQEWWDRETEAANRPTDVVDGAQEAVFNIGESLRGTLENMIELVGSQVTNVVNNVKEWLASILDFIGSKLQGTIDTVQDIVTTLEKTASAAWRGFERLIENVYTWLEDLYIRVSDLVRLSIERVGDFLERTISTVWEWIREVAQSIKQGIETALRWIGQRLDTAFRWIGEKISGVTEAIGNWVREAIENTGNWIRDAIETIREFIGNIGERIGSFLRPITEFIDTVFGEFVRGFEEAFEEFVTYMRYLFSELRDFVDAPDEEVAQRFAGMLIPFAQVILQASEELGSGLTGGGSSGDQTPPGMSPLGPTYGEI